ncbi:DUF3556 domain-containing protein [Myxococcota bacterium]|nr:DUF3556 domain-containing protein [Myxococcota bacterium]
MSTPETPSDPSPINLNAAPGEPDFPTIDQIVDLRFADRLPLLCKEWASQRSATPFSIIVMYWAKYFLLFIGGWAFFASFADDYPGFFSFDWFFTWDAFQRAVLWCMLYELLGFGCSSGPMNGKFSPLIGGFLYFARPGTTKLSLVPNWPILGGVTRSWLDVIGYVAMVLLLGRVLIASEITPGMLAPALILLPILGLMDKTLFLAARAEHYYTALVVLALAKGDVTLGVAGSQMLWMAIWFWAAMSKVNHHFGSVIMVMMNNGPFFPTWLKSKLFVDEPHDLRPSPLAHWISHFGAATEASIPFLFLFLGHDPLMAGLIAFVATGFHGFIALNNPSGMPIEWNIMMIYGSWALFFMHPEVSVLMLPSAMPVLFAILLLVLFVIPAYGNFYPRHVSFLIAMRYYAGNWAYNTWLFRGDAIEKLKNCKKASGTLAEQLEGMGVDELGVRAAGISAATSRFLHLQGRVLHDAVPHAVDDVDNYEWFDGEMIAGMTVGWNFGDGHLGHESLARVLQPQCQWEPGEVRVISVEAQPLFGPTMKWRVFDVASGPIAEGETQMGPAEALQPWPVGERAEAFHHGSAPAR